MLEVKRPGVQKKPGAKRKVVPGIEPGSAESESAVMNHYTTQPNLLKGCLNFDMMTLP